MFRLSNTPAVPVSDDELAGDADEPPDQVPELKDMMHRDERYSKSMVPPPNVRRESLLTRAITGGPRVTDAAAAPAFKHGLPRALSTGSSQSIPSTADLTSDCELTSPARSASPSPPPPTARLLPIKGATLPANKVVIAPVTTDDKPAVVDVGEAAVEKTLGRKRCIMFACSEKPAETTNDNIAALQTKVQSPPPAQPRKCRLTFACPTRMDSNSSASKPSEAAPEGRKARLPSPAPKLTRSGSNTTTAIASTQSEVPSPKKVSAPQTFHEFGSSQDETDSWVDKQSVTNKPKLTLDDVMRKENAIRKIAQEAEEEADEEDREQDELEDELDEDNEVEDDFAPSDEDEDEDEGESDGGNESDDEGGFADSEEESDAGSEYQFWAPSITTAATSVDALTHFSARQRSRSSSLDSAPSHTTSPPPSKIFHPRRASKAKAIKMRPGTPELPDSTDFVCGTLDEDRPLEAAFISCREQKKRDKHILIPQDIDPSFPTSDPEDEAEAEEQSPEDDESEPAWVRGQFGVMDDDTRGRRRPSAIKLSPSPAMPQLHQPRPVRPPPTPLRRSNNRSPAPVRLRSPAPRRLFGNSPSRPLSPAAPAHYRSPRGSPANMKMPLGITINRLAQRPSADRTASLPQTPNPFFRNWKRGSPPVSRIPSAAVTPSSDESVRPDLHVRGPVDIVIGLEKKREKRKEKFWRQHCRKAAKEQSERRRVPGLGVERMKELGLECAERTRAYGLGQQAKLVLSL